MSLPIRTLTVLALLLASCLAGCGGVLDTRGPVGHAERIILLDSLAIMLAIVVPTIVATLAFAWWFRASNKRAEYLPTWAYSGRLEFIVWAIPALTVLFLGGIAWIGSHDLDPYAPLESKNAPVEIEVVSLDWKWLFIYPEAQIASVNELTVPAATPIHFRLTSGTVMNSFFVPQLGSQIYTMAGMTSQLSLLADAPGVFRGISAQFSGDGFADMHFEVHALSAPDYAAWLEKAKAAERMLDATEFAALSQPGVTAAPYTYGRVAPGFFDHVLAVSVGDAGHAHSMNTPMTSTGER